MKADIRRNWMYRDVTIIKCEGEPRYFGSKHGEYLRRWWRVLLGPMSWVLTATKEDAKRVIDKHEGC